MSVIKHWSTGQIGNPYADHTDRGNPNTKGLAYDINGEIIGPGIEGYIEEDEVLASTDNRPLINLVENDIILDKNISDVASEVDHGIFKNRYNEFSLEILTKDYYDDPEIPSSKILTTPLRIHSGSSIINGQVTRLGNQKILYFLRNDDSLIFPDYEENSDNILIELKDDNYFGDYRVVYTTISDDLPDNFESYEIKIVNKSTTDSTIEDRITIYKTYRDWEDIVPLKADPLQAIDENINFKNDINFGQNSEGYWLKAKNSYDQPVPGTYVSDVEIKKDIIIKDKFLKKDRFTIDEDTGKSEYEIVTDGIFFNDIQWSISEQAFDPSADIQDLYVDENDGIYFILRSTNFKEIFYKSAVSSQLQPKSLRIVGEPDSINTGIRKFKNYLIVYGTNGFIKAFDMNDSYQESQVLSFTNLSTTQDITFVYEWNDQLWIAGENKLWHSNQYISQVAIPEPTVDNPNPTQDFSVVFSDWTFTELDLNDVIKDESGSPIVKRINVLERTRGNIIIDTAINSNIFNLTKNGSFESGVIGETPTYWNVTDNLVPMNSTFQMIQSEGTNVDRWGNYKAILTKYTAATKATVYQDYLLDINPRNRIFNFSVYLKSSGLQSSTIGIAEYDKYDQMISFSEKEWTIDQIDTWIRPELAFRVSSDDTKYLRYYVNCESNTPLQIDGAQLEEIDNTGIEITDITCAADNEGSLGGKYFLINSPLQEYYVWINVDMDGNGQGDNLDPKLQETTPGSGIPLYPELANKTGVEVDINKNETAEEVANNVAAAINFLSDFSAYRILNTIKVQVNTDIPGQVVDAEEGTLRDEGFVINVAVQGLYQASQYVENYEYLFIGFEKQDYNVTDQPFALIDINNPTGPDAIKYVFGKYGNVRKINTALHDDSNRMYVADDKHIYSLTFLNNYNSYDRFTLVDIGQKDNDLNLAPYMYKFETIVKFDDRILFGGTVDNRVIKTQYKLDAEDHNIEFKLIEDINVEEFLTLMGDTVFIHANGYEKATLEFKRTQHCFETINTLESIEGYYKPDTNYGFKVYVDGELDDTIIIKSPKKNYGPWTIQAIYEQIQIEYQGTKLNWLDPQGEIFADPELNWRTPESSSVKTDGFYSIGQQDLTRHIRGNIHKIFIPENQNERFYIIRGKQIFQSKFDSNVLKDENGNYPEELQITGTVLTKDKLPKSLTSNDFGQIWFVKDIAYYQWLGDHWEEIDYYTRWKIYDDIDLIKYKHIDNVEKTFADSSLNKVWVDLPVEPGYKLLKGSLRLKTNHVAEVGFTEGEDYFVDYDYNKIIRSDTINLLKNPEFSFSDSVININNYNYKGELATYDDLPIDNSIVIGDVWYVEDERNYYRCVETPAASRSSAWLLFSNDFVPLNWNSYIIEGDSNNSHFIKSKDIYDNRNDVGEFILETLANGSEVGVIYQTLDVDFTQETYTFSVDLKAYNYSKVIVRISECDPSNINSFGYDKTNSVFTDSVFDSSFIEYEIGDKMDLNNLEDYDKWHRVSISHSLTNSQTTMLRVEIYSLQANQLLIDKTQLEKNSTPTPFINGTRTSRIDPNMHVWIDYIEYTSMEKNVDYSFDTETRKITILENVDDNEYFYFKYKYEKIFNPYDFGNSKPVTLVNYDERDDYFILKPEGHIWAINQMFAMLSLESEDPLKVNYKYYFPRVDQIKIRNNPDRYGNFIYIVKGTTAYDNPYKPNDIGVGDGIRGSKQYFNGVEIYDIVDDENNDVLYEINIVDNDYNVNDIYDRRIYIDAKDNLNYNISLLPETLAYFPFKKDFNSTNGLTPLNFITNSKIIPIIKNFSITQLEEVGAWHDGYQLNLRTEFTFPGTSFSVFVDPINGDDNNDGKSENSAYKTVQKAVDVLYYDSVTNYVTNIIITQPVNITENIEIDKPFTVSIIAKTYCNWIGSIQNISKLNLQGIWFKNTAIYPFNELNIYYCTFENSSINCTSPQKISIFNTEALNNHNSLIRVKNTLYPSPFTHPYMRIAERDDGITGYPESVATSDNESIAPGDTFINAILQSASVIFQNSLIHHSTDHVIEFDPEPNWSSNFTFDFCTIADNAGLFSTPKYDLNIVYSNSILFNNREVIGSEAKIFNSNSSITFDTCFIDFPNYSDNDGDSANWNYKSGELLGRESCIYSEDVGGSPQFIGEYDYHLKSIAKGSTVDSPVLEQGTGGLDLGCYAEIREQTEHDIPKKLKNYTAFIDEALKYAMTINSEKITVTLEFKPTSTVTTSGILFDTRVSDDDLDYIVLAYNNNADDDHSLIENPNNPPDNPHRFRVIVANKEKSYSVISPIQIHSDEEFQKWHRLSFTINYEKIINSKPKFDEYNKLQNIIIFYHNDQASIESFVKYDLSRYTTGELIPGRGGEDTNAWNFNTLTHYITIGAAFDNTSKMTGYYDEFRIDNRFIDRKQFELWNVKKVQFNDPVSYVNQIPLARSLNPKTLNEYWSLKTKYDIGAKGNKFLPETEKRMTYEDGYRAWFIGNPTQNIIANSNFNNDHNALAETDVISYDPILELNDNWKAYISSNDSRKVSDNENAGGITLNILDPNSNLYSADYGYQELGLSISDTSISSNLGAGDFPFNIKIDGNDPETLTLSLEADPGYQEIDTQGITTTTPTGLNVNNIETDYTLQYTLYPSSSVVDKTIKLEGVKEITEGKVVGSLVTLKNKYFEISSTHDDNRYYVWYAEDNGSGLPTPDSLDPAGQYQISQLVFTDANYAANSNLDGTGFILYDNNNQPIYVWFDYYSSSTFSDSDGNRPSFVDVESQIVVGISNDDPISTISSHLSSELNNAYPGEFIVSYVDNIINIQNTVMQQFNPVEDNSNTDYSVEVFKYGSQPNVTLDAVNLGKKPIMVLLDSNDTQETILDKTSFAMNESSFTDNILTTHVNDGNIEMTSITFNTDDKVEYDSKYFTLIASDKYGVVSKYYVWFDAGLSGQQKIVEITCKDDIPNDPNTTLADKFFVFSMPDNTKNYVWYNVDNTGRDPGVEHDALSEIFTLTFEDVVSMKDKTYYAGKYFEFSTTLNDYYVWYTVEGVGTDPAIPGRNSLRVDLGQEIDGVDQRSQIIDATMDVLNAQVIGFVSGTSLIKNPDGTGTNILKFVIPEGDVTDPTIGSFDSSELGLEINQQGTDYKAANPEAIGTSYEVNITSGETANAVAVNTAAVMQTISGITVSQTDNIITVTWDSVGEVAESNFGNISFTENVIQVGINPTINPNTVDDLSDYVEIHVIISSATNKNDIATTLNGQLATTSFSDIFTSSSLDNIVNINTVYNTEYDLNPENVSLGSNINLFINSDGKFSSIIIENVNNGVVGIPPLGATSGFEFEIIQQGEDADTSYGSLIDELNAECSGDLTWSIVNGRLRATTIAQGDDATVEITDNSDPLDLITALGDPVILTNVYGTPVDDTWNTVLNLLNQIDSRIGFSFVGDTEKDIRITSKTLGKGSSIELTDTSTGLIAALNAPLRLPVDGYSKMTIHNQYELESCMKGAFKDIDTYITWAYRNDRLIFYTDDYMATTITVDFGDDQGIINSNQYISGNKEYNLWDVSIINSTSVEDTTSFNYLPEYNKFSENSLFVKKISDEAPIYITQNIFLQSNTYYTFSAYIYSTSIINNDVVKFKLTNNELEWTKIEKIEGNWWRLVYTFKNQLSGNYMIGFVVNKIDGMYIDSIQMESKPYVSPYVESINNKYGKIGIGKSLINKEKGTLFFKFKPYFKYEVPTKDHPIYIVKLPAYDSTGILIQDLGLEIIYYFDEIKNRGIFKYSINNLESSIWEFEITEDLLNQWHSLGFVYDFTNKRFIYWFDYFNYIIDSPYTNYTWGNLWIGHDGLSSQSANIVVKDIIIDRYITNDTDIHNWNTAYEFFNESYIESVMREVQDEIEGIKQDSLDYADLSEDLENQLNILTSKVYEYETNEINNNDAINKISQFVEYPISLDEDFNNIPSNTGQHETRITNLESITTNLNIKTDDIQQELNDIINGGSSGITATSNLVQLRNDIDELYVELNTEKNTRTVEDQNIKDLYASTIENQGASLIGVNDANAVFSSTNVEDVLQEIAGIGRTTESLKSLSDDIDSISQNNSELETDLEFIKDGSTNRWTRVLAQSEKYNVYDIKEDLDDNINWTALIRDNDSWVYNSYQDILTNNVSTGNLVPLDVTTDYSIIINSQEYYFTTPDESFDFNELVTLMSQAINTNDGSLLSSVAHVENVMNQTGTYDIRISDIINLDTGFTISVDHGVSYNDLINGLNSNLSEAVKVGTDFDSNTMNTVTLSNRIDSEEQNRIDGDNAIRSDLASNDQNFGASLIGISNDTNFVSETVEDVLQEISGIDRNTAMTISGNYNAIQGMLSDIATLQTNTSTNASNISALDTTTDLMKDGNDGSTWDATTTKPNLMDHEARISTNENDISSANIAIANNSTQISNLNTSVNNLNTDLQTEITNRINGDSYIMQQLADTSNGMGASLIGIEDSGDHYTSTTVEGALAEIDGKIAALAGALSWQSPVNTYADLPTTDNEIGDARTVLDDGDGHQAQYVWTGTTWVKIADIDWGNASSVNYDNSTTEIPATNVQAAIDYVYFNQKDKTKAEGTVSSTDWIAGTDTYDGLYYVDINHNLGTENIVCLVTDNGIIIGVEEIERLDENNVRIYVADNTLNLNITIFGVIDKYSIIINNWTPDGTGAYYADITHNINSSNLMVSTFDIDTSLGIGWLTGTESIEFLDSNTIRLKTYDNTTVMNVFIINKSETTITKDIQNWIWSASKNAYEAVIPVDASYDAIYNFFDPNTGRTIGIDMVQLDHGTLTLTRTQNDTIRMVIVK